MEGRADTHIFDGAALDRVPRKVVLREALVEVRLSQHDAICELTDGQCVGFHNDRTPAS